MGYMMQSEEQLVHNMSLLKNLQNLLVKKKQINFLQMENHFMQEDVDSLAAWGFNSIRVPLHYNLFTLSIQEEPNSDQAMA